MSSDKDTPRPSVIQLAIKEKAAPYKAAGSRTQGVGIQFPKDEKSHTLKLKIEEILGSHLASERSTQTI